MDDSTELPHKTTASELFRSFHENLATTDRTVDLQEFLEWMRVRGWPEARKEIKAGQSLSLYQAHDGYAVKIIPLRARPEATDEAWPGLPTRIAFEETTYIICTRLSDKPNRSVK